jgi:hypothetical protein
VISGGGTGIGRVVPMAADLADPAQVEAPADALMGHG